MRLELRIVLDYAVGGITAEVEEIAEGVYDGHIIEPCAPIFQWMVGKGLSNVVSWVASKKGEITFTSQIDPSKWHGVWGTN